MPLTPKYTWEQDEGSVTLTITLTSAAATRNARVECTDAMVKVTCPPYFLQVSSPTPRRLLQRSNRLHVLPPGVPSFVSAS